MRSLVWKLLSVLLLLLPAACQSSTNPAQNSQPLVFVKNEGSDTIVNLALAWAEMYQNVEPGVSISVTGGGSGTGLNALISGSIDLANASRKIKAEEIETAKKNGITPVETIIARDAIAVIINPANPVEKLTLEQISQIYKGEINNWAEVGGENWPIVRLSRETNSGTHVYFLESVIRLGSKEDKSIFSASTLLLPSSEGIIAEVRDNPNAIGYDGLGYVTDEVKVVAVGHEGEGTYYAPSVETVNDGKYAISRDLYMYSRIDAPAAVRDYLTWIISPAAQKIVQELGFVPVVPEHNP
ncbi:MAG TPA: PstS family phosphate ABC transporter substrate-binding protein [Bellilinea sp.]|nr:PstS family phosphate ABC transporter substrate-binding protein [Bellilinea sp.]